MNPIHGILAVPEMDQDTMDLCVSNGRNSAGQLVISALGHQQKGPAPPPCRFLGIPTAAWAPMYVAEALSRDYSII
ncbi:hypothetical protein BX600DRAFT_446204 [Xylariales sp. PMI_506]|nr:hypothetical protein BX600DRAFT_446204 [Xylariales sp. PMI_506]